MNGEIRPFNSSRSTELDDVKLVLALWHATFSKYQSWEANNVPASQFKKQVLLDFKKLHPMTERVIFRKPTTETIKP